MSRRLDSRRAKRLGKLLAGLLRHFPEAVGLRPDEEGWVDIDELVRAIKTRWRNRHLYQWLKPEHVYEVAAMDDKGRFEVRDGRIRATYGHSYKVKITYPEDKESKILYHGTTRESLRKILSEGIKPMRRLWVHLSSSPEDALLVALRKTRYPVILKIDAEKLRRIGPIYKAGRSVRLVKYVPPECIIEVQGV